MPAVSASSPVTTSRVPRTRISRSSVSASSGSRATPTSSSATTGSHTIRSSTATYDLEDTGVTVPVTIREHEVFVKVWKTEAYGNSTLYLLDTDIEENQSDDRWICGQLYGWFKEERLAQEIVLGRRRHSGAPCTRHRCRPLPLQRRARRARRHRADRGAEVTRARASKRHGEQPSPRSSSPPTRRSSRETRATSSGPWSSWVRSGASTPRR